MTPWKSKSSIQYVCVPFTRQTQHKTCSRRDLEPLFIHISDDSRRDIKHYNSWSVILAIYNFEWYFLLSSCLFNLRINSVMLNNFNMQKLKGKKNHIKMYLINYETWQNVLLCHMVEKRRSLFFTSMQCFLGIWCRYERRFLNLLSHGILISLIILYQSRSG